MMTGTFTQLRVEMLGHVAHVRLARPERLNALTNVMIGELVEIGNALAGQSNCRAVVISGEGRGFCSGIDLDSLKSASSGEARSIDIATPYRGAANIAQHAVLQWQALPVPVIAAVHGVAFGGGFQLALGADIRIVHPAARLALMEVKWGLIPDMAGMVLLRDLLAPDVLADLIFTGRIFNGEEALQLGLATRVSDDPIAAALEFATEIAASSPDAVRALKRLLRHDGGSDAILRAEAAEQAGLFGQPNQREAVAAALAKRPGQFS